MGTVSEPLLRKQIMWETICPLQCTLIGVEQYNSVLHFIFPLRNGGIQTILLGDLQFTVPCTMKFMLALWSGGQRTKQLSFI